MDNGLHLLLVVGFAPARQFVKNFVFLCLVLQLLQHVLQRSNHVRHWPVLELRQTEARSEQNFPFPQRQLVVRGMLPQLLLQLTSFLLQEALEGLFPQLF